MAVSCRHIMLSSMGTSGPKATKYLLNDQLRESVFSAFGLWKLLPEDKRPTEVWFLLTPEAKDCSFRAIVNEATSLGLRVETIDLPGGASDDTRHFLEIAAKRIPDDCQLTLNITEGLRHHAFLFFALALYLSEFRKNEIQGVWYCRLETANRDDPKPVIDLKPILDLTRWFQALSVFRKTGSFNDIAGLISDKCYRESFQQLSTYFLNGMPIEAGNAASQLLEQAKINRQMVPEIPLASEIRQRLLEDVQRLAGQRFEGQSKKSVDLTNDELDRQGQFIDRYIESGQYNLAFGLMREWVVSFFKMHSQETHWLDYETGRKPIEQKLGGLDAVQKGKDRQVVQPVRESLFEEQRLWAKRWGSIAEMRNTFQHHGMKMASCPLNTKGLQKLLNDWENRSSWKLPPAFGGGHGRLLVCPIGMTPGVLYSAIKHTQPHRLVVICSDQSLPFINEAVDQIGFQGELQKLVFKDPFTGIDEFSTLTQQVSKWLFDADEVHANLTGGTTLMGALVSSMLQLATREFQRPVYDFVLIDKRSPEVQRNNPWQLGDIHYFSKPPTTEQLSEPTVDTTDNDLKCVVLPTNQ